MSEQSGYIGNGLRYGHEVVGPLELADDKLASMVVSYVNGPVPGDDQVGYETDAKISIDADGAGGKLKIVVTKKRENFGEATTDRTYTISAGAAGTAWASSDANTFTASAKYLYQVIDLLNGIPNIYANILHAPWDMDVNSDDFMDLAEQSIPHRGAAQRLETLNRDVSDFLVDTDHKVAYMRIGLPEEWDQAPMRILNINGVVADGQEAGGIVRLYVNNRSDIGKTPKPLVLSAIGGDNTQTVYLDRKPEEGIDTKGSLILEINSSTLITPVLWLTRIAL